jgi:uroporphyrinogen decarboxylase
MDKIERVRAALSGRPTDRAPFTIWYHFGNQHAPAARTADLHLEFFDAYDLDLLKVMNDYDYPMPEGLDTFETPEDLAKLGPLDVERTPLAMQLDAVERIAARLRGRALFVDTVFNAWNTMRRSLVKEAMERFMTEAPDRLEAALRAVNDTLIRYALGSLERGAAGIFFSVPASAESLTREQFERFMRPFDLALLEAVRGRGECHVLHAHGSALYLDRLLDYPVQVLSWADRNGGPEIEAMRSKTGATLMAGIDHVAFPYRSARATREEARGAVTRAGATRFILAPGCSVPTYGFPAIIRAARDAGRR